MRYQPLFLKALRGSVLLLITILTVSINSFGQITEDLGCLATGDNDVVVDLDRKAWAGMGNTGNHSEGYHTTFELPGDSYGPCMKITEIEVTVTIPTFDYTTNLPANCSVGDTYLNISVDNPLPTGGATVPQSEFYLANTFDSDPRNLAGTYTFSCDTEDMSFGEFIGIDLVPVMGGGCQTLVSDGSISIDFEICVEVTIDLAGAAGIDASAVNSALCLGEDIELLESDGNNVDWAWDGPNSFSSTDQNPTITNITAADAGTYSVTVTDGQGCTNEAIVPIMILPDPVASATVTDNTVCPGQDIIFNEVGGDANSWDWSGPDGFSASVQDPIITNSTGAAIGTYTVTITDGNGCSSTSEIDVNSAPSPGANATAVDQTVCENQDIILGEDAGDATDWDWSGPNGFSSSMQNPTIPASTAGDLGLYTVTITNSDGCTNTSQIDITAGPPPDADANVLIDAICPGENIELDEVGGEAVSWSWSGPNSFTSSDHMPIITNTTVADLGFYTVTVTDINNCTNSSEVEVSSLPPPAVNATAESLVICPGQDIELDEDEGDADSWMWSGPDGFTSNINSPTVGGATTVNFGTYTVTVTDADGCTSTDEVTIESGATPNADASALSTAVCPGDDISLVEIAGDGTGWTWTGPDNFSSSLQSPTISNSTAANLGTYTVVVTDNSGCTNSSSVVITEGACACTISEATLGTIVCNDNTTASDDTDDYVIFELDPQVTNGGTGYTISVTNGSITPSTGTYGSFTMFQLDPGTAGGGLVTFTVVDNSDPNCTITSSFTPPGSCSTTCNISSALLASVSCNDNATGSDASDDYITFTLDPQVTNGGAGYTITTSSGTATPTTGTYGSPTSFQLQNGSAGNGDIIVTVVDNADPNCVQMVTITDPGSCSGSCNIAAAGFSGIAVCDDNDTPTDDTDDIIQFILDPNGSNTSTNYNVTPSSGSLPLNIGIFGQMTNFEMQPGSAGQGDIIITITDGNDPNCMITVTITDPGTCSDAPDCPLLGLDIGDPCDDGDPLTMNDTVLPTCECIGSLTFDCPTEMVNFGDACDDNNPDTSNDVIQPDCTCAGEYDCPALMQNIGDPCDDMDPATMGDAINSNCECEGFTSFDCPNEMVNFGDSCDDNNPDTSNDIIQPDCTCAGEYDCPALMLNIGDPCDDMLPNTVGDIINSNCECEGTFFDCPTEMVNFGDPCDDNNPETSNDIIQPDCSCAGEYDCPALLLNIGDPCDDTDPMTMNDMIQADCTCAGQIGFDCPNEMVNFGDPCDDNNPETSNDVIQPDCSCAGEFDCPALMVNIGDPCDDMDPNTDNDLIDANCDCAGESIFDCPALMLNIGDPCNDGDPNTLGDEVLSDCTCSGVIGFDCPMLSANIGDPCDDDNPNTENDTIDDNCICVGEEIFDCPGQMANIGDPCDDANPSTENDLIDANCDCVGTIIYDCPTFMANIGDPCDDANPNTENDILDDNCDCIGQEIFDCPTLMANIGDPCNDGDPATENDIVDSNCNCFGQIEDCMTLTPVVTSCDDGIDCTINDVQSELPDGTICEPCLGERITCDSEGETVEQPCDDLDPLTFNDIETVLLCDGSVCEPCMGTLQETFVYIPTVMDITDPENQEFGLYSDQAIKIISMGIYDRWGQLVFDRSNVLSSDTGSMWDGRKNNRKVNQGVYVYRIEYMLNGQAVLDIGQITVLR